MRPPLPTIVAAVFALSALLTACNPLAHSIVERPRTGAAAAAPTTAPATVRPTPSAPDRQPTDLAPCPGINPDIRRPAGSNCLGILPYQCGADAVPDIVGKTDSPALRSDVMRRTGNANVRWIGDGDAVIENLDYTRLNIELDAQRRVRHVDCY